MKIQPEITARRLGEGAIADPPPGRSFAQVLRDAPKAGRERPQAAGTDRAAAEARATASGRDGPRGSAAREASPTPSPDEGARPAEPGAELSTDLAKATAFRAFGFAELGVFGRGDAPAAPGAAVPASVPTAETSRTPSDPVPRPAAAPAEGAPTPVRVLAVSAPPPRPPAAATASAARESGAGPPRAFDGAAAPEPPVANEVGADVAVDGDEPSLETSLLRLSRQLASSPSAPRLTVTVRDGLAQVVVGGVEIPEDAQRALRKAVARTLAADGLELGELVLNGLRLSDPPQPPSGAFHGD